MKTYSEISEQLKSGLSKMEIFEKLNIREGKAKELAGAIATFPSPKNYLAKQDLIKKFFTYFMIYSILLFSHIFIAFLYKKDWLLGAAFVLLSAGCFYIFSFAKKGVLNAMVAMLIFPLLKTIELGVDHISTIMVKSDVIFSPAQVLLHYITSAFFLYSLLSVIYGIKLMRDVFAGEKIVGRMKWDSEAQKPTFTEELSTAHLSDEQSLKES